MADVRILISAGDDSGDLHAANLMQAIARRRPDVRFVGLGMQRMREAGMRPLYEEGEQDSAMWLHNILRLGYHGRRRLACLDYLDREGADLVLPVDFGGFNLHLCRGATERGVPVFYYIPPQVWAHGRYRLKKLRKWITHAGLIYPFEPPLYRDYGVPATYVGHPVLDEIAERPPRADVVAGLRERFGPRLVGVLPGSRVQEVRSHMPMVAAACRLVRERVPDAAFAMLATEKMRGLAADLLPPDAGIEPIEGVRPTELARASAVCLAKSGTVTLELATEAVPTVIFYHVGAWARFHFHGLSDTPFVGIVNNIAGRMVCPEKLTTHRDAPWLAEQVTRFLTDPEAAERCRAGIRAAVARLGGPGASERAAEAVLDLFSSLPGR